MRKTHRRTLAPFPGTGAQSHELEVRTPKPGILTKALNYRTLNLNAAIARKVSEAVESLNRYPAALEGIADPGP